MVSNPILRISAAGRKKTFTTGRMPFIHRMTSFIGNSPLTFVRTFQNL